MSSIVRIFKSMFIKTWQTDNFKMVIVVRTDISMGRGKLGAQCAHAAVECYKTAVDSNKHHMFKNWFRMGQPKIVLRVMNENELVELARKAKQAGLIATLIRDAGRTQLQPGTISVLGIGPGPTDIINTLTSHLKLL